jgi:CNT family concentrative nucleoside transporter
MKLTKELLKQSLLLLFIFLSTSSFSQENNSNLQSDWYRRLDTLQLKADYTFYNTDTLLSKIRRGFYKKEGKKLIFSSLDFSQVKETNAQLSIAAEILKKDTLTREDSLSTYLSSKAYILPQLDTISLTKNNFRKLSLNKSGYEVTYQLEKYAKSQDFSFYSLSRGLLGVVALVLLAFLFSTSRRDINWSLVIKGLGLQVFLAILILKVPFVEGFFEFLARGFRKVIDFSHDGAHFLFGDGSDMPGMLKNFAFYILPSVVFFSAISSLLYYFGILQKIVKGMAWVMKKLLGLSGSESVAAAGNVFIGQTEAPLLVKPYLKRMTKSELMCLMVGGMATIAGGVLAAVIGILGEGDAVKEVFYAKHLLAASLMSAPAAIVFSKILVPEKEKFSTDLSVAQDSVGVNALEAITNGTTDGLKLAVNVGAMLLVFVSLIALANYLLGLFGNATGLNDGISAGGYFKALSFEAITGYLFSPLAWLMGVEWYDAIFVGQLLGEKTILNEFIAYPHMGQIQDEMSFKSVLMSTYVLCGFANIASIGIQVGGIGILIPERKSQLTKFGVRALIGGTLACMMTAVIVGVLY